MKFNYSKIVTYLIVAIVLYFSFSVHILLGIAAIVAIIAYLIYSKRDAMIMQRAMMENNNGNRQLALSLLDKAYTMNPSNPVTAANYAYLSLRDGQIDKANQLIEPLLHNKSVTPQMRTSITMTRSLILWKQDKLDEALGLLESMQEKIKTTVLYGSLGYFYIEKGDLDQALTYNLEALDYNDTDPIILDNLLLTYILRSEWEQASEIAEKLMAVSPKFPEAYYHDGLLKLHEEDYSGALERFDTALSKNFTAVSTESREEIERKREETALLVGEPAAEDTIEAAKVEEDNAAEEQSNTETLISKSD